MCDVQSIIDEENAIRRRNSELADKLMEEERAHRIAQVEREESLAAWKREENRLEASWMMDQEQRRRSREEMQSMLKDLSEQQDRIDLACKLVDGEKATYIAETNDSIHSDQMVRHASTQDAVRQAEAERTRRRSISDDADSENRKRRNSNIERARSLSEEERDRRTAVESFAMVKATLERRNSAHFASSAAQQEQLRRIQARQQG